MKASTVFHPDRGYIVTTFGGRVTLPELGAHVQSIWLDPSWKAEYNGLLDFSDATIDLSDSQLQDLTKSMMLDPRCSFGRWALVVSKAVTFAKLRKIDDVADLRSALRIFFDRRTAEEWLLSPGRTNQDVKGNP
jgi:hypothetical protein